MLVIYNELGVDAFASMLRTMDVEGKIKVYVFSNNRYAYTDNFVEVLDKVELCALPAAIYDAYNAVLKPIKNDDDAGDLIIDDNESKENDEQGLFNFSEEGGER
jgi:adenine-specific DNA-methyltransferase